MPYGIFICCLEIDIEKSVNMSPFDTLLGSVGIRQGRQDTKGKMGIFL